MLLNVLRNCQCLSTTLLLCQLFTVYIQIVVQVPDDTLPNHLPNPISPVVIRSPSGMTATPEEPPPTEVATKQPCRLCYYDTDDTVPIFAAPTAAAERSTATGDYAGKIARYLYLRVRAGDHLPQVVCWMCSQMLCSFDQFFTKINKIQQQRLKEGYEELVIGQEQPSATVPEVAIEVEVEEVVETEIPPQADFEVVVKQERESVVYGDAEVRDISADHECIGVEEDDGKEGHITAIPVRRRTTRNSDRRNIPERIEQDIHIEVQEAPDLDESAEPAEQLKSAKRDLPTSPVESLSQPPAKRRGRPRKSQPSTPIAPKPVAEEPEQPSQSEGESEDDYPTGSNSKSARHQSWSGSDDEDDASDNPEGLSDQQEDTDWAKLQVQGAFPAELMSDGLLLVKGRPLMRLINRFYNLTCDLCTVPDRDSGQPRALRFRRLTALQRHYERCHDRRAHVRCCEQTLNRYPAIIMHMARHLQPSAFRCEHCGYVVTRPRFLEAHRQTHLPDAQKPYGCGYCERRFCWKRALVLHERTHQEAPDAERRLFVCQECGKIFQSSGGLCTHRKNQHSVGAAKPDHGVCHICAKSFATRAGLNEHMELHRPREHTQLQCTVCDKWLMNQRCLKNHMILHNSTDLRCDQCDYTTKKLVLMHRHQVNKHTDDKPFACQHCDKRFKLKRPLTVHQLEAHSERGANREKYQCPFCDRQFNSSTNFYTHRKRRHPEELAAWRAQEAERLRRKRIAAGVEEERAAEQLAGKAGKAAKAGRVSREQRRVKEEQEIEIDDYLVADGGEDAAGDETATIELEVDDEEYMVDIIETTDDIDIC